MTPRLRTALRILGLLVALVHAARPAFAQAPPENVKMRIGPVYVDPSLALTNAGVDNNVFNDPKSAPPTSDATFTLTPRTDFWVRFGPSWLSGGIREDLVYFKDNAGQRSSNNSYSLSWNIPLNRITFRPTVVYTNTRERPGFEIDTRALHTELQTEGQVEVKWFSKSSVVMKVDRYQVAFDPSAMYEQISLRESLNRITTSETVSLDYHVTPLTTMSANYSIGQDRFQYDTLRNAKSSTVSGAVKFDPAALIKGSATVGYDDYRPDDPSTPGYRGLTATVALSYVFVGSTKLGINLNRSVQYSYDVTQPYYLQTGGSVTVAQQVFGPIDVTALGLYQQLAYQTSSGAPADVIDPIDHVKGVGVGIGYHLSRDTRVGFNVEQDRRDSPIAAHTYTDLRYGFSVTYGSN
jgi:hypothetical protein